MDLTECSTMVNFKRAKLTKIVTETDAVNANPVDGCWVSRPYTSSLQWTDLRAAFNWRRAKHLKKMAGLFHCYATSCAATVIYISNSFSLHCRQIPVYIGHESSPAIRLCSSRRRFKFSATPFLAFILFVFFSFSVASVSLRLAPKENPVNKPDARFPVSFSGILFFQKITARG